MVWGLTSVLTNRQLLKPRFSYQITGLLKKKKKIMGIFQKVNVHTVMEAKCSYLK